jgi:hypothetical protein
MLAFIPYVPPQPPSPRAEELGQRLAETIEQYRQQHPDLDRTDVRQATRLALARSGGGPAVARGALVAVVAGALLLGLFAALAANGGRCPAQSPVLVIAVMAAALLVLLVLKRR